MPSTDEKVSWPAWYYGPNDQAEIFESAADVPTGWVDHPAKVEEAPVPKVAKVPAAKAPTEPAAKKTRAKKQAAPLDL